MLDARPAVLRDERVDRVRCLQVGEIGPGAENAQRAQLAPMLVRHEIVRIVRACAGVQVAAENLARDQAPRNDTVGAVLVARHVVRAQIIDVADAEREAAARVGVLEEGMPGQPSPLQDLVQPLEDLPRQFDGHEAD